MKVIDGNEAAVSAAYRLNEVCCIYPITPSSPMAELADEWSAAGRRNVWGSVPAVVEMQSEGGAAGALHGALQSGALTTTFTASQGLLLMIPNMYKIAGELTPATFHVAARALAAQGLSIFGDHSDVMAVRSTGFALLASSSPQEAHDLAAVAQAASLATRVPFVHFFDGFRTSHELNEVSLLSDEDLRCLVSADLVREHRSRALSPDRPFIRGTAQNPDVYFQGRETVNPFYARVPEAVQAAMDSLGSRAGRRYRLASYHGHPEAERVIVVMGSGAVTAAETAAYLAGRGERVGVVQVRLYRPFPVPAFLAALPSTARRVAVLDRTKEPGSPGEPLFLDVVAALADGVSAGSREAMPLVTGGRYGLGSKEFTPGMVAGIFAELAAERPRPRFTIGINDDVSGLSLPYDPSLDIEPPGTVRAVFYGLGSDGTVGANKNSIKIIGASGRHAQGYFVYDSRKSGSETVSHLRFGPSPVKAPYLIGRGQAGFVGVHQEKLIWRPEVLGRAAPGAAVLLNTARRPGEVWASLPRPAQAAIVDKKLSLWAVDATGIARAAGLGGRVNTVLQTCFFAVSGVLPREAAIAAIKDSIAKTYGRRGPDVVARNNAAVDAALAGLHEVPVPDQVTSALEVPPPVPDDAPEFVRTVTAAMLAGRGDELPVSALPPDGTYPSGTTRYEKRNISDLVAAWDPDLCIQCGNCSFVCPHSVIRSTFYPAGLLAGAPEGFASAPLDARGLPDTRFTLQVYGEDCTGCGLCVEACPVPAPADPSRKAINLEPASPRKTRRDVAFFETLPAVDRARVDFGTVRGTQFLQPLFEFSGACAGCGETPYLKLLSQLFGDRLMVANATGCSSIYGGNLPTTPWARSAAGQGPAWSNSLFEDNAEFGLGFRLAADQHLRLARERLAELRPVAGEDLADAILRAPQRRESEYAAQRARVAALKERLLALPEPPASVRDLLSVADHLVRRSVWIVGGDGWAYDIGSGGLDHVLASGRDVNVLVLDTEVYSNTGGQASKATPLGAVAKFAAAGKRVPKKDLALQAIAYGNVYVARVAMGADPQQTLRALREAEAYDGPSLVIAYSHCIAHGIEKDGVTLRNGMDQQYRAVASGYWPLMRYDPLLRSAGENPFLLDSPRPRIPLAEYMQAELRFRVLARTDPAAAERLAGLAREEVAQRWATYEEMAARGAERFPAAAPASPATLASPATPASPAAPASPAKGSN
ncbi:MAG TPA: pyruvate:ferredoxin (flavodoxin) oxidoreductase [Trebonia sp.]|nr:pyruvate:ferredoxin (flavodoxin) oxidoreductase [Trebonia sp.]